MKLPTLEQLNKISGRIEPANRPGVVERATLRDRARDAHVSAALKECLAPLPLIDILGGPLEDEA